MKKLIIAILLLNLSIFAGDFVDTQITFTFSDDNIFETSRRSNSPRFGEIDDELFNENLNTSKSGDETESHLVVYKKFEGYIPKLTVESALVLEFSLFSDETGESGNKLREKGSYIKINYGDEKNMIFSLTAFPYDSDRFLLGFTYDLSWGGQSFWPKSKINKTSPVPGVKFDFTHQVGENSYNIFVGAKTRPFNINEREDNDDGSYTVSNTIATTWAFLGGGYFDFNKMVRLDIHAGRFYKGTNPLSGQNVEGKDIYAHGVSGRLSYRSNYDLTKSQEMSLYRNDPRTELKVTEKTDDKKEVKQTSGYMFSVEGVYLTQPLKDPDNRDETYDFNGWAFDVKLKMFFSKFKFNADFLMRNVEFLVFNVPGFTAYEGFSENQDLTNEMMFSIGGEYDATDHLTFGILFGYKIPATYKGDGTDEIIVIKDREDMSSFTTGLGKNKVKLPQGKEANDIIAVKLAAVYEIADGVTITGEVSYLQDKNDTEMKDGILQYRSDDETNKLGFALILQSTF